jgi:hypothetical protein
MTQEQMEESQTLIYRENRYMNYGFGYFKAFSISISWQFAGVITRRWVRKPEAIIHFPAPHTQEKNTSVSKTYIYSRL